MTDELFMQRCFQLAQKGAGNVSPNPMVGAVLIHENKIIGEGWHQRWGEAHAEVNCLNSVSAENQVFIPYSTLFCNLEPCAHAGKTPPCADLIIARKIPRVVIANTDPNPLVAGKGLKKLTNAGVDITEGILSEEGAWLNRAFFTWIAEERSRIILKWAQTADGFMGLQGERSPISSPEALRLVHRWRSECDAILVGTNTAVIDNPRLDTRYYFGRNPLRIVLDTQGKLPENHFLLDDSIETWIYGISGGYNKKGPISKRTRYIPVSDKIMIVNMLEDLKVDNRAILLVEGGANLLSQFLEAGYWDEIRMLENSRYLHGGIKAPQIPREAVFKEEFEIGADKVRIFAR